MSGRLVSKNRRLEMCIKNVLGANIRIMRNNKSLTVKELAEKMEIYESDLISVEAGSERIHFMTYFSIIKHLGGNLQVLDEDLNQTTVQDLLL